MFNSKRIFKNFLKFMIQITCYTFRMVFFLLAVPIIFCIFLIYLLIGCVLIPVYWGIGEIVSPMFEGHPLYYFFNWLDAEDDNDN